MSIRRTAAAISGIISAAFSAFRPREDIEWRDASPPGRIATVDGVGVHYVEQGRGPTVVLIHGFAGHTFNFRYLIPDLARHHRVVALDLKGFGYSERPDKSDYSLGAQARLVTRLMDTLGVEQAALVGHSMGGEVAMRVSAGWPERVERLVLAASISGERLPTLPLLPIFRPVFRLFARMFGQRIFKRMFFDPKHATPDVLEAYRAPSRIRGSADAAFDVVRHARRDKSVDFKRITQHVLILWASHDRIVPRWVLGRLHKRLPAASVIPIAQSGHLLLEEQPEACNAAIRSFLAGVRQEPATPVGVVDTGGSAS